MKDVIVKVSLASMMLALMVSPIMADGSDICTTTYGGQTECPQEVETPQEEITHETVDAGVGENLAMIAVVFMVVGGILKLASVSTKNI